MNTFDELSTRARNTIRFGYWDAAAEAPNLDLLCKTSERDFGRAPNVGKKTVDEIRAWLSSQGLRFMSPHEELAPDNRVRCACCGQVVRP